MLAHYEVTGKNETEIWEAAFYKARSLFNESSGIEVVVKGVGVEKEVLASGQPNGVLTVWQAEVVAGPKQELDDYLGK